MRLGTRRVEVAVLSFIDNLNAIVMVSSVYWWLREMSLAYSALVIMIVLATGIVFSRKKLVVRSFFVEVLVLRLFRKVAAYAVPIRLVQSSDTWGYDGTTLSGGHSYLRWLAIGVVRTGNMSLRARRRLSAF